MVLRAEEEAAALRRAGPADDAGDLGTARTKAVLAPASGRSWSWCRRGGHLAVPLTWGPLEQREAPGSCPVPLPQQHLPGPRQGPRVPGSAAHTAAPCALCPMPYPRPGQRSQSGRGWTGCSAGLEGPAWLYEEQGRFGEVCGGQCPEPQPHMWLLLVPGAAVRVLQQDMGGTTPKHI